MKNIRTLVIDDDDDWRDSLVSRVEAHPKLELIGAYESPIAAYDLITEGSVDLILLDIEMPEVNGVAFMKNLLKPPMVIFVTAHRDFAIDSYDVQAIDYLLKPLSTLRFRQAIEKVLLRRAETNVPTEAAHDFFFIKENNSYIKIEKGSILFLKSMENYTQIVTKAHTYTTLMSLSKIEETVPPLFQRVHRSYVVNISKVTAVNKSELFIDSHQIPLSRGNADDIMNNWVKSHLIGKGSIS